MEISEKSILSSPLLQHTECLGESNDNCARAAKRKESVQRQLEPHALRRRAGETHEMVEKVRGRFPVVLIIN